MKLPWKRAWRALDRAVSDAAGQLALFEPGAAPSDFEVRVSRRARRLTVRVYPGGRVEVTAPAGARPAAVQRFVAQQRQWIDARVAELRVHALPAPAPLPGRVQLCAVDEEWRVDYGARARGSWLVSGPGVVAIRAPATESARARAALRGWLLEQGRRALVPWLERLARERGFEFGQVQLRRQRTRWGSCSRSGTISLNVALLFQPTAVVRYLFLHELCHLRHMNHSARFWRLVATHEPEWRALDRELMRGWRLVPDWLYA